MHNYQFSALCSRTWNLPVLALLAEGRSARVSPIAYELGAGRTPISSTFSHLVDMGLVARNAGHGHPLRPEFALTDEGHEVARWALHMREQFDAGDDWKLVRRNWTLPVLRLTDELSRYSSLRRNLSPITDRALSLTLRGLDDRGWLERNVTTEHTPPQVSYIAAGLGRRVMPYLKRSFLLINVSDTLS